MAIKSIAAAAAQTRSRASAALPGESTQLAIDACMSAFNRTHDKLAAEGTKDYLCDWLAGRAYLKTAPALAGYQNLCDFIACINYGSLAGIIGHSDATHYLENARVALSAIYHQPRTRQKGQTRTPKTRRPKKQKSGNKKIPL